MMRSDERHGRVAVRSYRVVFRLERRIFRIDRYRLPFPYGLEVRAIVYAAATYALLLAAGALPVLGTMLGLLPAPLHWGVLPLGTVFVVLKLRVDGRPPHRVLASIARWARHPKHLTGLRPTPRPGTVVVPLAELWMRPDWHSDRYRKAIIAGPNQVTLRYPATVEVKAQRQLPLRRRRPAGKSEVAARELVVRDGGAAPMFTGKTVTIPDRGRMVFR
jgi:hypothetical protein